METSTKKQIQVSLFIGALENSTLRMHLNHSHLWKQASILRNYETPSETHYQGKSYIGFSIPSRKISLQDLRNIEINLRKLISSYCPDLPHEEIEISIFSQILIT